MLTALTDPGSTNREWLRQAEETGNVNNTGNAAASSEGAPADALALQHVLATDSDVACLF